MGPDRSRLMPASAAARLDHIQAALRVLREERARFERLGFEQPQARCHADLRYWGFLEAIHSLPGGTDRRPFPDGL
jgi:hypothetical protein